MNDCGGLVDGRTARLHAGTTAQHEQPCAFRPFLHQQRGREGMGNGEQGRDAGARGTGGECGRTATATTRAIRKSKSTTRTIVHVVVASACWGERTRGIRMVRKELSSLFCRLVAVISCRLRHVVWHTLQLVPYRCCFRVGEGETEQGT